MKGKQKAFGMPAQISVLFLRNDFTNPRYRFPKVPRGNARFPCLLGGQSITLQASGPIFVCRVHDSHHSWQPLRDRRTTSLTMVAFSECTGKGQ